MYNTASTFPTLFNINKVEYLAGSFILCVTLKIVYSVTDPCNLQIVMSVESQSEEQIMYLQKEMLSTKGMILFNFIFNLILLCTFREDSTQTGHSLGHSSHLSKQATPQRDLSPGVCTVIRLIMHAILTWSSVCSNTVRINCHSILCHCLFTWYTLG